MKIQFCGAAGSVTGSCILLTTEKTSFLLDCGLFQGTRELKERNYCDFLFSPAEIDFVLLSHAHVDHCGLLPKLYKAGFRGKTHATKATKDLCAVVLPDCGHIQEMEVERKNRKLTRQGEPLLTPIYTSEDARDCLKYFQDHPYGRQVQVSDDVKVTFQDAGHILGSSIIEVVAQEEGKTTKVIFSGDLGNINQPIVEDPTIIEKADVVILEATYGNRYHLESENRNELLTRIINKTHKKGGNLIIPSFAVERTQDLIYHLKMLREEGKIPEMDIYIDSPMAIEATKVFINNPEYFDKEAQEIIREDGIRSIFEGPRIHYVLTAEESMAVNRIKSGAIIISASGMADAGRIKHHLKHNLWRKESTVLFVGYQAEGTLGRRILDGEKKVRIHGEEVAVKADIEVIDGYSAHADQKGLLDWLGSFKKKPNQVFLVHGEEEALSTLHRLISSEYGINVEIPCYGGIYDLERGLSEETCIVKPAADVKTSESVGEAIEILRERVREMAKAPNRDVKLLQRLLAQISEIERELGRQILAG